ncbi:MAG: TraR/DksA family transcriptional regulator [Ectothiorhodospiraceae bacterium]
MDMTTQVDTEAIRQRLLDEYEQLLGGEGARREGAATVTLDQTRVGRLSRMDALQGQAMAQAVSARARERMQRINAALRRLDSGDHGYCVHCDEPIGAGRLEADPATASCLACAEARER